MSFNFFITIFFIDITIKCELLPDKDCVSCDFPKEVQQNQTQCPITYHKQAAFVYSPVSPPLNAAFCYSEDQNTYRMKPEYHTAASLWLQWFP